MSILQLPQLEMLSLAELDSYDSAPRRPVTESDELQQGLPHPYPAPSETSTFGVSHDSSRRSTDEDPRLLDCPEEFKASSSGYNVLRCSFGQGMMSDVLPFGDPKALTVHEGPRNNNLFRLIYCLPIIHSAGNDIQIVEYTDKNVPKTRPSPQMHPSRGDTGMKWAVVSHVAMASSQLSRSMLYTACLAAHALGFQWLWLDKLCVMSQDTRPEESFGEAHMGAAAVLCFPGRHGLKDFASLQCTSRRSLLRSPYTFISFFMHSTRRSKYRRDNCWVIHEWNERTPHRHDNQLPNERDYNDYWQNGSLRRPKLLTKHDAFYRQLIYLTEAQSAMTNIKFLLQACSQPDLNPPDDSKSISLWRHYHIKNEPENILASPDLLFMIKTPTIIDSEPPQSASDTVADEIKDIIHVYSTLLELGAQGRRSEDPNLCNELTKEAWKIIMLFEPTDPTSFSHVLAWTLGLIHEDKCFMKDAFSGAQIRNLSYSTWSINGPPLVIHHWWKKYSPRFLTPRRHKKYTVPLYLRGLEKAEDPRRYEDFQYYLEINDARTLGRASEPFRWVITGYAMPISPLEPGNGKYSVAQLRNWSQVPEESSVERVAVFSGYYEKEGGDRFETILILRRNEDGNSWYNEDSGILPFVETALSWDKSYNEFEIIVPVKSNSSRQ